VASWGPSGQVGFQLLVGGNQGQAPRLAWHIPVFIFPEQVPAVTASILRVFRNFGNRHNRHQVRLRYLIERLGPDRFLVEIEKELKSNLDVFPKPPPKPSAAENFVGWFKQKQQDLWAVGICVPVGRLTWDQFEGIAIIAQQYGWGTIRTTQDQNLVIPGIPSAAKQSVGYAIARHGLTFEPDPVTRSVVACTGKQFCNIAVTETKGYTYQLMEALRRRNVFLHDIRIHMSGCPSSCAMSYTSDIGLKGGKVRKGIRVLDAFDVYLGGGLGREVQMGMLFRKLVPVDQLPDLIESVVKDFYLHRGESETFSQYWRNRLQGHKAEPSREELPRWRCSQCAHIHIALDPPYFCPVCAALRAKFEPAPDENAPSTGDPASGSQTAPLAAPTDERPWVCSSCGARAPGREPPELCPVCGGKHSEFRRKGMPARDEKVAPAGRRILIVGGSIAGHTAAQTARSVDPGAQITLVTDERHGFYNRLNLTRFLSEEIGREELFDVRSEWYAEHQIKLLTESRVIGLDPIKKTALLSEGRELEYDSCILAHGSAASLPPFYRHELEGVFSLRTLGDVEDIAVRARRGANIAVVGGGVLGLEAAFGMVKRGAVVKVFEYAPQLMPRQLDREAAALFAEMVRAKGIEAHTDSSVKELLGSPRVEGLALADGRRFEAELVVLTTGIKPNTDWVRRSGIHCDRGVVVDDRMQTSTDAVFAAGDVAQWRESVVGLWTSAIEQAKVAAVNAAGGNSSYRGFLPVTILKCLGIPLVSMGEIAEDGGGYSSRIRHDLKGSTYRRVVFREGIPVGAVLLGSTQGMGELRKLIENGLELEHLRRRIVPDEMVQAANA